MEEKKQLEHSRNCGLVRTHVDAAEFGVDGLVEHCNWQCSDDCPIYKEKEEQLKAEVLKVFKEFG